jgi:hypothetical protein
MKMLASSTAILLFCASMASAALNTDALVADFQAQGFTRVEVKSGLTQTKVEAIRGTEKVEVVYDSATGAVLSRETQIVEPGDDTAPGVSVEDTDRDFVGSDDGDDGDSAVDDGDDSDSADDNSSDEDNSGDDAGDDDGDNGTGAGDDSDDHDDGDDHGGGDDHDGGDDHGGGDDHDSGDD